MTDHLPPGPSELEGIEAAITRWAQEQVRANPAVVSVERGEPDERRWYVRLHGENKDVFSVWFTLRQRTLRYETYLMPAPRTNAERLYAHLLRRNDRMRGVRFAIGDEEAVYLVGEIDVDRIADETLDRVLGTVYAATEDNFVAAMRIGFEGLFRR